MGMHFGVLASELPSADLLRELGARAPRFVDQGPLPSLDGFESTTEEGWDLAVGDLDGRGYLVDGSYLLSGMEPDLLAGIAAATGALVVGCAAETVSGSFGCVVAQGSTLRRHYYHCHAELSQPYSVGEPFPSEQEAPLDDLDGAGFLAILRSLGFDFERWQAEAGKRRVSWTGELPGTQSPGPLGAAIDAHRKRFLLDEASRPPLTIQVRDPSGRVIELDTGVRLGEPPKPRKPWWRFW